MSNTSNVLSGFIQLTLSSTQLNTTVLESIANNSHPVTISFAPRSTVPELQGNIILDSTDTSTNTCTYRGNVYVMVDVQICSVMNAGFQYAGTTSRPIAELIITFAPNQNLANTKLMDGILLCLPIYDSGTPTHNEYLTQLIDPNMPACNYTNNPGTKYTAETYQTKNNSSLMDCVKSCCNDPNCISYNFSGNTCKLNNVVSSSTTANSNDSSGTINRTTIAQSRGSRSAITPTLQSVFFNSNVDTSQTSLAYTTTFNTVDANEKITSTRSLFIVVFPNGIHITSADYQQLILQMRNRDSSITSSLLPYRVPLRIRNFERTVKSFRKDSSGNIIPVTVSNKGEIAVEQFSDCDSKFKNRVEWYTKPPLVLSRTTSTKTFNSEKCPYYKTSQYKCVPFDQLHDLSGNNLDPQDAYVIPGNTTLQSMINKKQPSNAESVAALNAEIKTTEDIITYGAIGVVGITTIYAMYRVGLYLAD